ncbi:MAG: sulfate ABC transporter permease subunit CysW [Melioribacteraceae bacterium]
MSTNTQIIKISKAKTTESFLVKCILISIAIVFLTLFLLLPLFTVFHEAFSSGIKFYFSSINEIETLNTIKLSLIASSVSVLLNTIFGISAAWAVTRYTFKGKNILLTMLDIPFTISPVISGMMFVLLLGSQSLIGGFLSENGIDLIFAAPGIVIATLFVTFPYIARELIPQMIELGKEEEEAALLLGAKGFKIFFKITLPNIKWSLMYGIILCNARAIGEFGAVSVVSGHIRGLTNTMPLHIEILYNEYNFTAAFAVSSLLTFLALLTLIIKSFLEWKMERKRKSNNISYEGTS